MADNTNVIYLIGAHLKGFTEKLVAVGYDVKNTDSYASIKTDTAHITAIVTIGHDDDFADPAELKKLLDTGVVLMAFSPSTVLLKGLHEASATIIDVREIEIPNVRQVPLTRIIL